MGKKSWRGVKSRRSVGSPQELEMQRVGGSFGAKKEQLKVG